MQDKSCVHHAICDEIKDLYDAKNADYGDSYARLRERYPESICIRLEDKLSRLETLLKRGATARVNESIEDTLIDIANYAIMELTEIRYKERSDD